MANMILKAIMLALCATFASLFIHLPIICFKKIRHSQEPSIFELMRQAKIILSIWVIAFLLYTFLFFLGPGKINALIAKLDTITELLGFIYGIIFYMLLAFIYLTIYYLSDRSVSATILEIIDNASQKKLTYDEIEKIYDVERKYRIELNGMIEGGFIIQESGFYRNSFKGHCYAQMAKIIKKFLRLGPGG